MRLFITITSLFLCGWRAEGADPPGYAHLVNGNGRCLASRQNSPNRDNWLIGWECLPDEYGQQWQQRSDGILCNLHGQCVATKKEYYSAPTDGGSRFTWNMFAIQRDPQDRSVERFSFTPASTANYLNIKSQGRECLYLGYDCNENRIIFFGWRVCLQPCTNWLGNQNGKGVLWQWRKM